MNSVRSSTVGVLPDLAQEVGEDLSLELFRRMCKVRFFELGVVQAVESRRVRYPVYLALGQEAIPAALSIALDGFQIFAQHRCHGTYLAFGGDPAKLRDEILGLPTGSSGGRAGSNCLQCHEDGLTMWGHHGLIGENVPLGVGAALAGQRRTLCLFGDGAAEEDYVFASMGFAQTHHLPVLFVCEDNNLSILTPVSVRRNWRMTPVAEALGMPALDIADDPWTLLFRARDLTRTLPAFINVHTCRENWHVGVGTDGAPEWDRFGTVKAQLQDLGLGDDAQEIETEVRETMRALWQD